MGMSVDDFSVPDAASLAMECIRRGEHCRVVTPNAEFGLRARDDTEFRKLINSSKIILADGIGVVLASRILGNALPQKSAGVEFGEALCALMARESKRLFILGAAPGVAEKAAENLAKKYPGLIIAGTHDGYFKDDGATARIVADAEPDALFVGIGSPRQEQFIAQFQDNLHAPVTAALGGSLDIYAGNISRAPKVFIRLGLEWLHRLILQPSRIKRMIKLPLYLLFAALHRIKHGKSN